MACHDLYHRLHYPSAFQNRETWFLASSLLSSCPMPNIQPIPGSSIYPERGRRRLYLSLPCYDSGAPSEFPNQGQSRWSWTSRSELLGRGHSAGWLGLTSCSTWVGSALRLHEPDLRLAWKRMRRFVYGWERVRDSGVARERSFFEGTATDLRRDPVRERK